MASRSLENCFMLGGNSKAMKFSVDVPRLLRSISMPHALASSHSSSASHFSRPMRTSTAGRLGRSGVTCWAFTMNSCIWSCSVFMSVEFESVFEPLRKELGIFLEQSEEVPVEDVGRTVVGVAAHDAPAGLQNRHDRLQRVPVAIQLHPGRHLPVAKVRIGHFGDDLEPGEVIVEAEALSDAGAEHDGGSRADPVKVEVGRPL